MDNMLPLLTKRHGAKLLETQLRTIADFSVMAVLAAVNEATVAKQQQQKDAKMGVNKNSSSTDRPPPCKKNKYQKRKRVRQRC
jgi:hypothetical protein